ncbi:MAG: ADP-ribosylglycohydrolase family protein [Rhodoplanes sp.]
MISLHGVFGIGQSATLLRKYRAGQPWPEAAARSAGNGALMRIAPVLVPHRRAPLADLHLPERRPGSIGQPG